LGSGTLCAVALVIAEKAYPCTEYSGSGTETVHFKVKYYYFTAIASTSSITSFGSLATSTHDLAG